MKEKVNIDRNECICMLIQTKGWYARNKKK